MEGQVISDNGENREIGKRMKGRDSGDRDNREDTGMEGGNKSEKWRIEIESRKRQVGGGKFPADLSRCPKPGSNRHVFKGHWILSPTRLPIPPFGQ